MKTKKLLLLGVSMLILAGCGGEAEEANGESEEGMGTLSTESEEGTGSESENAENSESESTGDSSSEESSHDSGLLDLSDNEEGWLNFEGEVSGNTEYRITPEIEYNPDTDYEINNGAYVTYYNGDEFIKTVQQGEGVIEQVEDADNIRVSYHNSFGNKIALTEQ